MALLSTADRDRVYRSMAEGLSSSREPCGLTKTQLRAALDAADAWADGSAVSYNNAIPQPARSLLTAAQKARILAYVILRRWEVG